MRVLTRVCPDEVIAGVLNRNGLLTGHGNRWTQERVTSLRSHHAIPCYDADKCEAEGWMKLTEAANTLGVSARTLRLAVERGEIEAEHPLDDGPWIFNRRGIETEAIAFRLWTATLYPVEIAGGQNFGEPVRPAKAGMFSGS